MRIAKVFFLALAIVGVASAAQRPTGSNCNFAQPPSSAGEEMNHGIVMRIHPRAKDIGPSYTGCQVLFAPQEKGWIVVSVTEVLRGDPVRVWSPHAQNATLIACRFRKGKVVAGDPEKCPMPEFLLLKSVAPGCLQIIRETVAKGGVGAPRPPECEYQ